MLRRMVPRQVMFMSVMSITRIWDFAPHNAFTDLIDYKQTLFCTFREADEHAGGIDGTIRILMSSDGVTWKPAAHITKKGIDLRDPKLSITPNGQLMLSMGGTIYREGISHGTNSYVTFSDDGVTWNELAKADMPYGWIWGVSWGDREGFGGAYQLTDPSDTEKPWILTLVKTLNGVDYEKVTTLDIPDFPSETTLRILPDQTMIALVRRHGNGWIGTSTPPYTEWKWSDSGTRLGGPNFIVLPTGQLWAASRLYVKEKDGMHTYMAVGRMDRKTYAPEIVLPSGGDTGYPGMVFRDGILYVSYYSSHEGKSSIYLAKIQPHPSSPE